MHFPPFLLLKQAYSDPECVEQITEMVLQAGVTSSLDGYCAQSDPLERADDD